LDDGRLTDNKGVTVDFKNTIIILTSNLGSQQIMELNDDKDREDAVWKVLKQHLKPEFLNRLDDIVIFNPLGKEEIRKIIDILIKGLQARLDERNITINLTERAKDYIAEAGFDPVFGARPLKRALYDIVEDTLAELILEDKVNEGDTVTFDVENGEIITKIN
jgi:ATP-dependent Clp protease ATP-binding subunit ClpB